MDAGQDRAIALCAAVLFCEPQCIGSRVFHTERVGRPRVLLGVRLNSNNTHLGSYLRHREAAPRKLGCSLRSLFPIKDISHSGALNWVIGLIHLTKIGTWVNRGEYQ